MHLEFQLSRTLSRAVLGLWMCLVACSASGSGGGKSEPASPKPLTILFTGELKGQIEPCGCTTDPLGDLARTAQLLSNARASGDVLYIDAGSTLYTHNPIPDDFGAQEDLKAKLLLNALEDTLRPTAMGLGPFDLSRGVAAVKPPRLAANLDVDSGVPLRESLVIDAAGTKVGIFGVVSPAALEPLGISASPPAASAQREIADLRKRGARLVIGVAHMTKAEAKLRALEAPGADILVVGQALPEPKLISRGPDRVGDTVIVTPANRGQIATRLDVTLRGSGPLHDAIGKARAVEEIAAIEKEVEFLEGELARWKNKADADKKFIATKEQEIATLNERKVQLSKDPIQRPSKGPYFVMEQVRIRKALPCDPKLVAAKAAFDKAAGKANLAAAKDVKPKPAAEGTPSYVGIEECSYCHDKQVAFWKKMRHANAWKSLTDVGKEFNRDCIYCHVTGFGKDGGSNLAFNETLREVQCEVCHGPGSLHVEADGNDQPLTITTEPTKALCKGCHNDEHSDTFDFNAYLRDITGPGHGKEYRQRLGEGPTGRELRAAGLKKANSDLGAGCPK